MTFNDVFNEIVLYGYSAIGDFYLKKSGDSLDLCMKNSISKFPLVSLPYNDEYLQDLIEKLFYLGDPIHTFWGEI